MPLTMDGYWLSFSRTWHEEEMDHTTAEVETQEVFNGASAKNNKRKATRTGGEEKLYPCSQCSKKFKSVSGCNVHIKLVHKKLMKRVKRENARGSRRTGDPVENVAIDDQQTGRSIKKDKRRSAGHRSDKLKCDQANCTSVFSSLTTLSKHKRFVHNKEKSVCCLEDSCGKKFTTKQKLANHLRSAHGAARLVCNKGDCNATFRFSPHYYQHLKKGH